MAAAEADWRAVEAGGILTPYQRFDWIRALLESGLEPNPRLAIVVLCAEGTPVGLLPLQIDRHLLYTAARLVGTIHGNSDWLAATPDLLRRLTPQRLEQLLADIATAIGGVDLFGFFNQPAAWLGSDNPLLGLSRISAPNNLYAAEIPATPLPFIEHGLPARHRGNIRRSARRLEEGFGPLSLRRAETEAELERQHETFLAQRSERFAQMGVHNIFGEPAFVRFFRLLAQQSFGEPRPALAFHALYAGDTIVATSCGTYAGNHYSHYINSMASGPAARFSLMSVLLARLFDELVTAGVTSIDMGTGDFAYKTEWTAPMPLFHSLIPVTARGRAARPLLEGASAAKRTIKQNPKLWRLAQATRRTLYRVRRRG